MAGCSPTVNPGADSDASKGDGDGDDIKLGSGGGPAGSGGKGGIDVDPVEGAGGSSLNPGETEYCQETKVDFVPKIPTAYVLVDRSGSMGMNDENFWEPLKNALLPALESLQADVRLGFGTYTSTEATQCGAPLNVLDDLGQIGLNNFEAIRTQFEAYPDPTPGADTPTSYAIEQAVEVLLGDTEAPGDRFIVLVTDGNPDFCDDVPAKCAQDATVAALQAAHSQGIKTLVFGLEATQQQPLEANIMALFANSGDGQPVMWDTAAPMPNRDPPASSLTDECRNAPYPALLAAEATSLGTYGDTMGTAVAFLGGSPETLVENLRSQVEGLKSCTFDLTEAGLEIKPGSEDTGDIFVDNMDIAIPMSDWQMNSTTELELLGASCELWKSPNVTEFFAGFPCESITIVIK